MKKIFNHILGKNYPLNYPINQIDCCKIIKSGNALSPEFFFQCCLKVLMIPPKYSTYNTRVNNMHRLWIPYLHSQLQKKKTRTFSSKNILLAKKRR